MLHKRNTITSYALCDSQCDDLYYFLYITIGKHMAHLLISSKYPENRSWFGDNLVRMGWSVGRWWRNILATKICTSIL